MTHVTEADLRARYDFTQTEAHVLTAVERAVAAGGITLLTFLGRFISWNGGFGAGVAGLSAKIGRSRSLLLDSDEPIAACADRSMHVASYFFDAARDEYDDGSTPHRDAHRPLAQATLKGLADWFNLDAETLRQTYDTPLWLIGLENRTQQGYGLGSADDLPSIFRAMGFHLGSEVLADREFSVIDRTLREQHPDLVRFLLRTRETIAGQKHAAYHWIAVHSGEGGGVEVDHFGWAVQGVDEAFRYVPERHHAYLREQVLEGFDDFARCHSEFFQRALSS